MNKQQFINESEELRKEGRYSMTITYVLFALSIPVYGDYVYKYINREIEDDSLCIKSTLLMANVFILPTLVVALIIKWLLQ